MLRSAIGAHRAGQLAKADRLYRAALKSRPNDFTAMHFLGLLRGQLGNHAEAARLIRRALMLQPESAGAQADLGEILRRSGDLEGASLCLSEAIRLAPHNAAAHHNLGMVTLAQERHHDALLHFTRASQLNPQSADTWHGAGLALQGLWRRDEAIAAFSRALALVPGQVDLLCALGGALLEAGDDKTAAGAYRSALAAKSTHVPALRGLAETLARSDASAALCLLDQAIALEPKNGDLHELAGGVALRAGDFAGASNRYRQALALSADKSAAYYGLSQCGKFTASDDPLIDAMLEFAAQSQVRTPARSMLHFALGKAMDDRRRYAEAMAHFDQGNALQREGTNGPAAAAAIGDRRRGLIDALVGGFDRHAVTRLRSVANWSARPIFILGMPRSGTTLVEQILGSHPDVAMGGELRFWTDLIDQLGPEAATTLELETATTATGSYLGALDAISPLSLRVTDKMPHNFLAVGLIHALLPNAKIVHCRRHPVDTSLSIYFTHLLSHQDFAYDRASIVTAYRAYLRLMAHWRDLVPTEQFFELDYEALIEDPERVTRALAEFCGLEWNMDLLSFHKTGRTIHTASAWQARQPLYRSSTARWQRYEPWLHEFRELLDGAEGG